MTNPRKRENDIGKAKDTAWILNKALDDYDYFSTVTKHPITPMPTTLEFIDIMAKDIFAKKYAYQIPTGDTPDGLIKNPADRIKAVLYKSPNSRTKFLLNDILGNIGYLEKYTTACTNGNYTAPPQVVKLLDQEQGNLIQLAEDLEQRYLSKITKEIDNEVARLKNNTAPLLTKMNEAIIGAFNNLIQNDFEVSSIEITDTHGYVAGDRQWYIDHNAETFSLADFKNANRLTTPTAYIAAKKEGHQSIVIAITDHQKPLIHIDHNAMIVVDQQKINYAPLYKLQNLILMGLDNKKEYQGR